jgi:hypothetical protein
LPAVLVDRGPRVDDGASGLRGSGETQPSAEAANSQPRFDVS